MEYIRLSRCSADYGKEQVWFWVKYSKSPYLNFCNTLGLQKTIPSLQNWESYNLPPFVVPTEQHQKKLDREIVKSPEKTYKIISKF